MTSVSVIKLPIPKGKEGVKKTLQTMAALAINGSRSAEIIVKAREIIANVPVANQFLETKSLYYWVKQNIRYVKDPVQAEMVTQPQRTLIIKSADCDCIATLLGALLLSIGIPIRFIAIKPINRDYYAHVFVEAQIKSDWIPADPTFVKGTLGNIIPHKGERLVQELWPEQRR